jgi:hypothetical protein
LAGFSAARDVGKAGVWAAEAIALATVDLGCAGAAWEAADVVEYLVVFDALGDHERAGLVGERGDPHQDPTGVLVCERSDDH